MYQAVIRQGWLMARDGDNTDWKTIATVAAAGFSFLASALSTVIITVMFNQSDRIGQLEQWKSGAAVQMQANQATIQSQSVDLDTLKKFKAAKDEQDALQNKQKIDMLESQKRKAQFEQHEAQHAAIHLQHEVNRYAEAFRSGEFVPSSNAQPTQ